MAQRIYVIQRREAFWGKASAFHTHWKKVFSLSHANCRELSYLLVADCPGRMFTKPLRPLPPFALQHRLLHRFETPRHTKYVTTIAPEGSSVRLAVCPSVRPSKFGPKQRMIVQLNTLASQKTRTRARLLPHQLEYGNQAANRTATRSIRAGSKHTHPATDNELLLLTRSIDGGPTGSGNNPPSSDPYPRATDDPPPLFPPSTGESNGVPVLLRGEAFALIPPGSYSRPSPSGPDLQ